MEVLTITESTTLTIKTVENAKKGGFDSGKIKVAALPPIAKKELVRELKNKGFCDEMTHTAMQCRLEDLSDYINVWKYVSYILAVELLHNY